MADEAVAALILTHVRRYTAAIDIMDIYKVLHQAIFGPGHAIQNKRAAREWLDEECRTLTPVPNEPLVENIHPTGAMVRLYLRPYLAVRGSLPKLLDAFLESSKRPQGELSVMAAWWDIFLHLTETGGELANRFSPRTVSLVGRVRASEHWPAVHHSPPYDRAFKPAYRVLTAPLAENLLNLQKIPVRVV